MQRNDQERQHTTRTKMAGIREELKGIGNKLFGALTRNENRKLEGEAQIVEGDNLKDSADQADNLRRGKPRPGDPTNM